MQLTYHANESAANFSFYMNWTIKIFDIFFFFASASLGRSPNTSAHARSILCKCNASIKYGIRYDYIPMPFFLHNVPRALKGNLRIKMVLQL